jgi:cell fate regulator YaaT (PSP1 superfamily)
LTAVYEVRFKGNRNEYFNWSSSEPLALHQAVIVDVDRGQDLGRVSAAGEVAVKKCARCAACEGGSAAPVTRRILRPASPDDVIAADELRHAEDDVRRQARDRVVEHRLQMKISDAEWQWDRKKLTLYFTAEQRVDFRVLVRDLAARFRTRIELRQIGARDEARRLSGVGRCGREYCSASWLPELRPVNLSVAKAQHLSLNPAQISGPCGRLLCCLHYEHDFYVESRKRFPKEGKVLRTGVGLEKVLSVDIFRDRVALRTDEGASRTIPLEQLKTEIARAGGGDIPSPGASPAPAPTPALAPPTPTPTSATGTAEGKPRRRRRGRRNRGGGPTSG